MDCAELLYALAATQEGESNIYQTVNRIVGKVVHITAYVQVFHHCIPLKRALDGLKVLEK